MEQNRVRISRLRRQGYQSAVSPENSEPKKIGGINPLPPSLGGEGGFIRNHRSEKNKNMDFDEILIKAKSLTAKQRQELLDQLSLANQISRAADQDRDLDMWVAAIHATLDEHGTSGEGSAYGQMLIKRLLGLSQNWRPVQHFMEVSKLADLKVVERASVYYMLAELLVKHARRISQKSGAPLGPKLVGSCASNIGALFEQSFPGYLQAGLAKIAARQQVAGVRQTPEDD